MNKIIGLILEGSDIIIHAGDVGDHRVLEKLSSIAPVIAVRGNTDVGHFGMTLPATETVQIEESHFYVLHDLSELDIDTDENLFQCIISGHTHQPAKQIKKGVLFVNPGSAGPRRYKLPVSVAKLTLSEGKIEFKLIELAV